MGFWELFTPKFARIAEQGARLREAGNYAQAISTYEEAASMGSCRALSHLYEVYTSGPKPYRDDAKANEILERMCVAKIQKRDPWLQQQMTVWAKATLGARLYKGIGCEQDYKRAFELLSSIDLEVNFDEKGQVRSILGYMYFQGLYVKEDYKKAYDYLSLASDLDSHAQYALGYLYSQGKGGAPRDKNMALTMFRRACKDVPAARGMLCSLATLYLADSPETAEKNLAAAAGFGYPEACRELIELYFTHTKTYTLYETDIGDGVLSRVNADMSDAEVRNIVEEYGEKRITGVKKENLGRNAKKYLEILVKQAEGNVHAEDGYDQMVLERESYKAVKRLMERYPVDCKRYGEELYPRMEKIAAR